MSDASDNADDLDDEIEFVAERCPSCGADPTYSLPCFQCGGEGCFDGYEDDPLWYNPGDVENCDECRGSGYLHWCRSCGYDFTFKRRMCGAQEDANAITEGTRQHVTASTVAGVDAGNAAAIESKERNE